jgi:hypothetical protein
MAYSYVVYTGDGLTTDYAVPFGYLVKADVTAFVAGEETSFTWLTDASIQFASAPDNGAEISIQRNTNRDARVVDFTNTSILDEETLDKDALQLFYIVQEAFDSLTGTLGLDPDDNKFDADGGVLKNIGGLEFDGVDQLQAAIDAAEAAQAAAEAAETDAEAAEVLAEKWAEEAEDNEVEAGKYSALHWAAKAAISAAQAAAAGQQQWTNNGDGSISTVGGDDLDLNSASIVDVTDITAAGTVTAEEVVLDDGDSGVREPAADVLELFTDNTGRLRLNASNEMYPVADDTLALGTAALAFSELHTQLINDNGSVLNFVGPALSTVGFQGLAQALSISTGNVAWNLGTKPIATLSLTENVTILEPTNMRSGGVYLLRLTQDATGGRTVSWESTNSKFLWSGGSAPEINADANKTTTIVFYSNGSEVEGAVFFTEA